MGDVVIFGLPVALGTMIYQALLFTVLFWLMKKFVLNKVVAVMEKRKQAIAQQLNLAERYRKEGELTLKTQQELLEKARFEARDIIRKGEKEAQEILKEAKNEAALIHSDAYKQAVQIRKRDAG